MEPIYKTFLSYDCAYKSIAVAHVRICMNMLDIIGEKARAVLAEIANIRAQNEENVATQYLLVYLSTVVTEMFALTENFVEFKHMGAGDVLEGRKVGDVGEIDRAKLLYKYLQNGPVAAGKICPDVTIIEHQPPRFGRAAATNTQSTAVSYQLAIYYAEHNPMFIDPKHKNNFHIAGLTMETFLEGATGRDKKYRARKAHTKANFVKFCAIFNIDISGIAKPLLDDVADAVWQIFAAISLGKC